MYVKVNLIYVNTKSDVLEWINSMVDSIIVIQICWNDHCQLGTTSNSAASLVSTVYMIVVSNCSPPELGMYNYRCSDSMDVEVLILLY